MSEINSLHLKKLIDCKIGICCKLNFNILQKEIEAIP